MTFEKYIVFDYKEKKNDFWSAKTGQFTKENEKNPAKINNEIHCERDKQTHSRDLNNWQAIFFFESMSFLLVIQTTFYY